MLEQCAVQLCALTEISLLNFINIDLSDAVIICIFLSMLILIWNKFRRKNDKIKKIVNFENTMIYLIQVSCYSQQDDDYNDLNEADCAAAGSDFDKGEECLLTVFAKN